MRELFRFLFRIREFLLFLLLMGISFFLLFSGNHHHRAQAIRSSNAMIGALYKWRTNITDYTSLREENLRLAEENTRLRNQLDPVQKMDSLPAPPRVDSLAAQRFAFFSAKVINNTWQKQKNYLTLDKGLLDGIEPDMGVIGPAGIVGVVNAASDRYATVISVLSPDVKHSVQVKRTGHFGLLFWDTRDPRTASLTDVAKHVRVAEGDTVVTLGADGIFPPGIPVGVVEEVDREAPGIYLKVTLRLSEDMTRNGYVHVVKDLQRAERDSLQLLNIAQ